MVIPREFNRDIYSRMLDWKSECKRRKYALEVTGPRQVGKTFSVKKFASENFRRVYYLNLFDAETIKYIKSVECEPVSKHKFLEKLFPDFRDEPDSVLILDEIQESSYVYNLMRPVNREMRCQLIVSGSYLGRCLDKAYQVPVGDVRTLNMHSLSFPEFLGVIGKRELYESLDLFGASERQEYNTVTKLFNLYCVVGGYPAVVRDVLETEDVSKAREGVEDIVSRFCDESVRYFTDIEDVSKLKNLMLGIASLLLREKRGLLGFESELQRIAGGTQRKHITRALAWLEKSGVVGPCGRYNDCDFEQKTNDVRFYFSDLGVANYFYRLARAATDNVYGRLAENFAYLSLRDSKLFSQVTPHFGTYGGGGEVDFLLPVVSGEKCKSIAVEVKAGDGVGNTASKLLEEEKIDYLVNARVDTCGGRHGNIFTIPLPLLGRFDIYNYIPKAVDTVYQQAEETLKELSRF